MTTPRRRRALRLPRGRSARGHSTHFDVSQFSLQQRLQLRSASLGVSITFLETLAQTLRELVYDDGDAAVLIH